MKVVALSAGHQPGVDPGASYQGLVEADLNIAIVRHCADLLRFHHVGVLEVPDDLNLKETIKWINERARQIDICVEVHVNAGRGTGVEVWHYHGSEKSKQLSQLIVDALARETGLPNRGIKDEFRSRWGRLGFVHDTQPLACLVECGFIDNKVDRELLKTKTGLEKFSRGIAKGILRFFKIAWNPPVSPPSPSESPPSDNQEEIQKLEERLVALERMVSEHTEYIGAVEKIALDARTKAGKSVDILGKIKEAVKEV